MAPLFPRVHDPRAGLPCKCHVLSQNQSSAKETSTTTDDVIFAATAITDRLRTGPSRLPQAWEHRSCEELMQLRLPSEELQAQDIS